jgi:uncharacterized membrane protein (UPF0127 family)
MLFLFPGDTRIGFWMKNTLIQLDIAYIGVDGIVREVHTREPHDLRSIPPAEPYRYTLEVNGGWFEAHGLAAGAKVTLPAELPTPQ